MPVSKPGNERTVSTYCYQCVAGPDLLKVRIDNGVATEIMPNFEAAEVHPAGGKVCVKAFGLLQKTYTPNRVLYPMKRTNPNKGREHDPGFVRISWDEALDLVADKLKAARAAGVLDETGFPRLAASFGGGGTPTAYMGTLPALLAAWGTVDMSFGSGQGVKCYHSEHLYGELWHRAFTVSPDTPLCEYLLSFGANVEASGGVCGVKRHADARKRGMKRVQIEPHLSVTGACSAEWVPIKPKTDSAFLFAILYVLLHEHRRERLDLPFLKERTSSAYLIAPNGYFLRDPETRKPLVFDLKTGLARPFDTPDMRPALEGKYTVDGVAVGPDGEISEHHKVIVQPALAHLVAHVRDYTPEWAAVICDVPAATIRRIANEYLNHARVGETIEIEGVTLPFRPVAIALGKTVNNGWGGYECCWARTLLACLVGALEVPGGTLGTTVRLNRPADNRWSSVQPGPDGFMDYPMNPTGKDTWLSQPAVRSAHRTLVPLIANSPWSQALGPTHLAWMMQTEDFDKFPHASQPDVWLVYRTNPAISFWDTKRVGEIMAKFPFTVCFAFTLDETNHFADVLLPDCTDLEGLQLLRIGGTKYVEQFWDFQGFALRDPAVPPQGEAKDFTWIATELARRSGLLAEYNGAINRGAHGIKLSGKNFDFSLAPSEPHDVEDDLGRDLQSGERRTDRGRRIAGARLVPRTRVPGRAVLAAAMVSLSQAGRERAALRAALSGAAVPHRQGAGAPVARARHSLVGPADRGIRSDAALARSVRAVGGSARQALSGTDRGLPVLARHRPQHAILLGQQCRHSAHARARRQRRRARQRGDERNGRRKARHRRRRSGRSAVAAQLDARPSRALPGYPP